MRRRKKRQKRYTININNDYKLLWNHLSSKLIIIFAFTSYHQWLCLQTHYTAYQWQKISTKLTADQLLLITQIGCHNQWTSLSSIYSPHHPFTTTISLILLLFILLILLLLLLFCMKLEELSIFHRLASIVKASPPSPFSRPTPLFRFDRQLLLITDNATSLSLSIPHPHLPYSPQRKWSVKLSGKME